MSYLCDLFFYFQPRHLQCHYTIATSYNTITLIRQTHLFFVATYFRMFSSYYFWLISWMKKVNNFQTEKVQLQGEGVA